MLIGSILNPWRGQTPPTQPTQPQPEPQPEPQQTSEPTPPPQAPPAAEPTATQPAAEPQPVAASPTPADPAPPASSAPPPAAPATSVAAALSANPPARADYQAMGSWIARGTMPVATVASAPVAAPAGTGETVEATTREAILRDAWTSVLAQANVARSDVIELLR